MPTPIRRLGAAGPRGDGGVASRRCRPGSHRAAARGLALGRLALPRPDRGRPARRRPASSACAPRAATRRCASPTTACACSPRRASATAAPTRRTRRWSSGWRARWDAPAASSGAACRCAAASTTPEGARWQMAMPDVYSIRNTTVEDYVVPIVHEVKVSRADLLGDLRRAAKRQAYLSLAAECWYVVREGIARPEDIPPECGLIVATAAALDVARPAPRRAMRAAVRGVDVAGAGDADRRTAARRPAAARRRTGGRRRRRRRPGRCAHRCRRCRAARRIRLRLTRRHPQRCARKASRRGVVGAPATTASAAAACRPPRPAAPPAPPGARPCGP